MDESDAYDPPGLPAAGYCKLNDFAAYFAHAPKRIALRERVTQDLGAEVLMPEYVSQAHHLSWQVEDSLLLVLGSAEAVKPEGMR